MTESTFKAPPDLPQPTNDEIKARRAAAGLTQLQAGLLIRASRRAWQEYESGKNKIPLGLWDLFIIRTPIGL